jgi:hypothetical protein
MQKKIWLGLLILTSLALGVVKYTNMNNNRTLQIWFARVPYSLDPLDYDALAHHVYFRSVYSSLVSDYKLGEITGVLASKWSANPEKTAWTFQIRKDLSFSDGQKIEPKDVAFSLNRAALMMKRANSQSGLLEHLKGIETLSAANVFIKGIAYDHQSVTLQFNKPMPDILTKISFGLYAIVSSKNFEQTTGEWKDKKNLIGSGPYKVEKWTDSEVILALRSDYPQDLLVTKPISKAVYRHDPESILSSDIVIDFDDSLALDESFKFHGPVKSAIRYIECEGWQKSDSICYDKKTRIALRNNFYAALNSLGFKTVKSFFPLAIKDVAELKIAETSEGTTNSVKLNSKKFSISKVANAYKSKKNQSQVTSQEAFEFGMNDLANKNHLEMTSVSPVAKLPTTAMVDFRFRMTAILVDSPHHDIQFMFKSEHGIRLPDTNGEIKSYVTPGEFSVQKVNEMLWEQGIIWPLGHMALGIWKKDHTVNLASYNLILPPLDLHWIGWE